MHTMAVLSKLDAFADFFAEGKKQIHRASAWFFFLEEESLQLSVSKPSMFLIH